MMQYPQIKFNTWVFLSSFVSSVLLLASGFFLGTMGIDDELYSSLNYFEGIGRGLVGTSLVTFLLPGQLGISFAPMFFGAILYSVSVWMVIVLWRVSDLVIACTSAAIMGCFPYFAAMMSFDAVQVSYPTGFILIVLSLFFVFEWKKPLSFPFGVLSFALAFSCYQGVATSFVTVCASAIGMRLALASDKKVELSKIWKDYIPRALLLGSSGSILYLALVKISQVFIPHGEWTNGYSLKISIPLDDPERWTGIARVIFHLLFGKGVNLPSLSVFLFALCCLGVVCVILKIKTLPFWQKVLVISFFVFSVGIFPFGLLFITEAPLSPRAVVGIGVLYAFSFAVLATLGVPKSKKLLFTIAGVWIFQFIFLGNEMYYYQYLLERAEHSTISRVSARIDAIAEGKKLNYPIPVVFVGRYFPAEKRYLKFDTLGQSALYWDDGGSIRQKALFQKSGIDGFDITTDPRMTERIYQHVETHNLPAWPQPGSVFLYNNLTVVVNWGI